jgi:hypothetical protein
MGPPGSVRRAAPLCVWSLWMSPPPVRPEPHPPFVATGVRLVSKSRPRLDEVQVESFEVAGPAPRPRTRTATRSVSCGGTCEFTCWDTCGRTCYETCRPRLCGM